MKDANLTLKKQILIWAFVVCWIMFFIFSQIFPLIIGLSIRVIQYSQDSSWIFNASDEQLEEFLEYENSLAVPSLIFSLIIFCIGCLIVHRRKLKDGFCKCFNLIPLPSWFSYLSYFAIGVGLSFISSYLVSFIVEFTGADWLGETSSGELPSGILTFIAASISGPVAEELLTRLQIKSLFEKCYSKRTSNILQAILFGILHGVSLQTIYAALLGYYMAYRNDKESSLMPSICMHIGFNFSAGLIYGFPSIAENTLFVFGIMIIGLFGIIQCLIKR